VGWGGAGTISGDYNASSDATAVGANSLQSRTFTFVNEAGGDYRIDPSDTSGAIGGGADLRSDATLPVPLDVEGLTRPAAPTIGYSEADPVPSGYDFVGVGLESVTHLGVGSLAQDHLFTGVGLTSLTSLGVGALAQGHTLAGVGLSSETALGVGELAEDAVFAGVGLSSLTSLGVGSLAQDHLFTGVGLTSLTALGVGALNPALDPGLVGGAPVARPRALPQDRPALALGAPQDRVAWAPRLAQDRATLAPRLPQDRAARG
jgi:hypothetical protein